MAKGEVTIYLKSTWTTCRRAKEFLSQKGVSFKERELFRNPLSKEEICKLLKGKLVPEFFAWRSPRAKALGLVGKELSDDEMISFMSKEPALIRRPLIVIGDEAVAGLDAKKLSALL